MRDRAAELGGSCVLDRREPHGTVVRARLPLKLVPL
jgi:signal transduction histidine kinase